MFLFLLDIYVLSQGFLIRCIDANSSVIDEEIKRLSLLKGLEGLLDPRHITSCLLTWVQHKSEKLCLKYTNLADDCLILQSDRFKRQVESGQEQLTQPINPFTVSATPEPEEWMLMGLGALALLFIAKRRRGTVS